MDATASNPSVSPAPVMPVGPGLSDWIQRYRWMILLRSFRLALDARQMIVASAAVLAMVTGWWGLAKVFSGASGQQVEKLTAEYATWPWQASGVSLASQDGQVKGVARVDDLPVAGRSGTPAEPLGAPASINAYFGPYARLTAPFARLFDAGLTISGFTFLLTAGIWGLAVWGYAGGVITRMAGVRLARDERATFGPALRHARARWGSYFWAPLMPLVGVLVLSLPIFALSWLLRFDVGVLVLGVAWPLFLVLALVMGILLLGLAVGWPLMWATISVEGTDSFDALSRTYAYVYQRPLHYLWYAAIAGGLGVLAGLLITVFAGAIVYLSLWCASWSAGATSTARIAAQLPQGIVGVSRFADGKARGVASPDAASTPVALPLPSPAVSAAPSEPTSAAKSGLEIGPAGEPTSGIFRAGIAVLSLWLAAVQVLLLGFGFSYFWTASTGIYLLLRQDVDATEMDVIHLEDEPAVFGLPPLENDAAGVAVAAEEEEDAAPLANRETKSAGATPASQ